jgi:hypothetical protein
MTQQPLLTADEVIELLKEALPDDEDLHTTFNELVEETKLASGNYDDPYTALPLLDYCVDYLRSKGIHVYFEVCDALNNFTLIAGECGRVIDEVCKLEDYLIDLEYFIEDNKDMLPPEAVAAEKKKLEAYCNRLYDEVIFPLEVAYYDNDKAAIQALLEKAAKLVEEINEGTKDLQHAYALAKLL